MVGSVRNHGHTVCWQTRRFTKYIQNNYQLLVFQFTRWFKFTKSTASLYCISLKSHSEYRLLSKKPRSVPHNYYNCSARVLHAFRQLHRLAFNFIFENLDWSIWRRHYRKLLAWIEYHVAHIRILTQQKETAISSIQILVEGIQSKCPVATVSIFCYSNVQEINCTFCQNHTLTYSCTGSQYAYPPRPPQKRGYTRMHIQLHPPSHTKQWERAFWPDIQCEFPT